jgi:hypothetical protein
MLLLERMIAAENVTPTVITFNTVISGCQKAMGKRIETDTAFQQALSLLERMSDFNIEPNKIRWVNGSLSVARTALSVASAVR